MTDEERSSKILPLLKQIEDALNAKNKAKSAYKYAQEEYSRIRKLNLQQIKEICKKTPQEKRAQKRKYEREYRQKYPQKIRLKGRLKARKYREENPEKIREIERRRYQIHQEKRRAAVYERRARNS